MVLYPNPYWVTARACGSLAVLSGFVGFVIIATATCVELKKRTWILMCAWFLLVTVFQGLQFLILKGDLCTEWTLPGSESSSPGTIFSQCSIARDGYIGIAAIVIWFVIAVGCSQMARRKEHVWGVYDWIWKVWLIVRQMDIAWMEYIAGCPSCWHRQVQFMSEVDVHLQSRWKVPR